MDRKGLSDQQRELIERLFQMGDGVDEDTVLGIVLDVEHPNDTQEMLQYLQTGKDVTIQNVILFGLWLSNRRYHPERNLAGNDRF